MDGRTERMEISLFLRISERGRDLFCRVSPVWCGGAAEKVPVSCSGLFADGRFVAGGDSGGCWNCTSGMRCFRV